MNKLDINPDLTPETADTFLLVWSEDVGTDSLVENTDTNLFFGHPKNSQENFVGIYIKKKLLEIDWTLNPENAKSRGCEWTGDSIYDPEAPDETMSNFFEMTQEGYLFGKPANVNTIENGFVGVYKPIEK